MDGSMDALSPELGSDPEGWTTLGVVNKSSKSRSE